MERIERRTLMLIAITLAIGFATWQLLSALGYIAAEQLIDLWGQGEEPVVAQFSIGGADIEYGQALAALITLALALAVAIPLLRRTAGFGRNGSQRD